LQYNLVLVLELRLLHVNQLELDRNLLSRLDVYTGVELSEGPRAKFFYQLELISNS